MRKYWMNTWGVETALEWAWGSQAHALTAHLMGPGAPWSENLLAFSITGGGSFLSNETFSPELSDIYATN